MPTIRFGADFSEVESASNKLVGQLQKIDDRVAEVTSTVNKFNQAGVLVGATVKGLTVDGQQFTAQLGLLSRYQQLLAAAGRNAGSLSVAGIAYKSTRQEVEKLTETTAGLEAVTNRVQRAFQYFVAYKAFNFVTNQIEDGVKAAKDFQIQLSLIRTLSQDQQQTFSKFGSDVRGVSDKSGIDVKDVGKAFYDTISNQIARGPDTAKFVETAAQFARVTGSDLPNSVNLLSSAINAYGGSAKDAERLSAIFFRTIDEGRVVVGELANTFGRVAVLGQNIGVGIEELNAVLAITTQKGFKTADAMTLLTNLLIKLEKPTQATKAFFDSLGVDSGEAAVKISGGLIPLINKMVAAVKSGQVDVSAFFDEIRGRKAFGIFEQSGNEIQVFADKLKDVTATAKLYQEVVKIRGESPADQLVIEANKLKNIFTVDLGQSIINFTNNVVKAVGGVDALKDSATLAAQVTKVISIAVTAYGVQAAGTAIANYGLAASFNAVVAAATTAIRFVAVAAVAYSTYKLALDAINNGRDPNLFGGIDPANLNASIEALDRLKVKLATLDSGGKPNNPFASLDEQQSRVNEVYKNALSLIAQANIANNKFLDEAKAKSKDASEALKVGFSSWLNRMNEGVNAIRKTITEVTNEIEKSVKTTAKFKDSLNDILFNTQLKFANGDERNLQNQKIQLTDNRVAQLKAQAEALFGSGDKDKVDEARRLFDEVARLEEANFERRTEVRKKFFEDGIRNGSIARNSTFVVQTGDLQNRLNAALTLRNKLEETYQKQLAATKEAKKQELAQEEQRIKRLELAFKESEKLDVFDKSGAIKPEFRDKNGAFDRKKLEAQVDAVEKKIRDNAGGTFADRVQLEILLAQRRKALFQEAVAQERAENYKTAQAKLLSENEAATKRVQQLKTDRQTQLDTQTRLLEDLGKKPAELAAFGNKLAGAVPLDDTSKTTIASLIEDYKKAVIALQDNLIDQGNGVKVIDPDRLELVKQKYKAVLDVIQGIRDRSAQKPDLTLTGPDGRTLTPGEARGALDQQTTELGQNSQKLNKNLNDEILLGAKSKFGGPLEQLKLQFPELATSSKTAIDTMNADFLRFANEGIKAVEDRLQRVRDLLNQGQAIPKTEKLGILGSGDATYAATGGIVGLFPGQPRGQDQYPIWAAAGETIISAETSAMYRPMLQAIMDRRAPRYMAGGGVVGDTVVGDINITVNGAATNDDTGRAIATKLERELRRRNIRL